jgi:glycosyltransferase involved in cell wall biosynthesis
MKNILLIANYRHSVGGISGQVEILIKNLNSDQIKADLFNTKTSNFKRLFLPILLLIKGKKYDIFHIQGCSFKGFYPVIVGVIIGKLLRKKVIITYQGGGLECFINKHKESVRFFINKANKITVPSEYLHNILCGEGIDSVLLPDIIRTDNISFLKRDHLYPRLIVTRSLEKVYNIPLAIHAFAKIKKKYPNASLRIVGDGSERYNLEKIVKSLSLKEVYFIGRVSNNKIESE